MSSKDVLQRVEQKLSELKISARAASLASGKGPDVIRNLQRAVTSGNEHEFRSGTLEALANALETTPQWLLSGEGWEHSNTGWDNVPFKKGDLPIVATRDIDGDRFNRSDYILNAIRHPEMLRLSSDAYGFVVENSAMAPAYEQGDVVIVDPRRGGRAMRDALILLDGDEDVCTIRRLERQEGGRWVLRRFNPPGEEFAPYGASISLIVARLHAFE